MIPFCHGKSFLILDGAATSGLHDISAVFHLTT